MTLESPLNFVPTNPPATPNQTQTLPHHIIVLLKKRGREIPKKFPVNFSSRWGRGKKTPHQLPCNSHLIFLLFPIKPYHLPIFPYHFPIPNLTVGSKKWDEQEAAKGLASSHKISLVTRENEMKARKKKEMMFWENGGIFMENYGEKICWEMPSPYKKLKLKW